MTYLIGHVTKVHMDDFISYHVVACNKLVVNWFVAKLYPFYLYEE